MRYLPSGERTRFSGRSPIARWRPAGAMRQPFGRSVSPPPSAPGTSVGAAPRAMTAAAARADRTRVKRPAASTRRRMGSPRDAVRLSIRRRVGQELFGELADAGGDADARQVAELTTKAFHRHDGLGHGAMPAGAADVREVRLHELAGVARVAEVPDAHDELAADDARHHRPLD